MEESNRPDQLRALLSRMPGLTHVSGSRGLEQYVREVLLPNLPPRLTFFQLNRVEGKVAIEPLRRCCGALQRLELKDCINIKNVRSLGACTALTSLNLGRCRKLKDINALAACALY